MEFVKGEDGKITLMALYQNGRDQLAPRISDTVRERKAIVLPREVLAQAVGTYELRQGFDLVLPLKDTTS